MLSRGTLSTRAGHCLLVKFFQRNALVIVIKFQKNHFLFAVRTFKGIITKGNKNGISPLVKTLVNMVFAFMDCTVKFGVNITMSGIKAAITNHFEILFGYVTDKPFDEIHCRNCFFNIFIVTMPVIVKSNHFSIIFVNTGSGDYRPSQIASDVFYYSLRIADIRFCKNIEAVFVVRVTFGFDFFERRTDDGFHFIEKSSTESIAEISVAEDFNFPPDAVITVTAFRNEAVDMGISL